MQRTDSFSIFKDLIIISSLFYSARNIYKIFVKYFTEFLSSFQTPLHTADLFKTFIPYSARFRTRHTRRWRRRRLTSFHHVPSGRVLRLTV